MSVLPKSSKLWPVSQNFDGKYFLELFTRGIHGGEFSFFDSFHKGGAIHAKKSRGLIAIVVGSEKCLGNQAIFQILDKLNEVYTFRG